MTDTSDDRYSRNLGLLGADGQYRLQKRSVAIVGLGGLGSHVAQQLVYLGTRRFVAVDPDVVETSNLNRLIGASELDVNVFKVEVMSRMIHGVAPQAEIALFAEPISSDAVEKALATVGCVFGCVDNDAARLRLTELTSIHRIPYFDLASDAGQSDAMIWYGGRVFVSLDGERCLSCAGELDQRALALTSMDDEQREADKRIYGVARTALDGSGPMVVSINGVVASLAVTEFAAWAAGLRAPRAHLVYRGDLGTVTVRSERRTTSCYYCDVLWGGSPRR